MILAAVSSGRSSSDLGADEERGARVLHRRREHQTCIASIHGRGVEGRGAP